MPKFGHCHCFLYSYLHFHTTYSAHPPQFPLHRSCLPCTILYRHHYQRRGELFFHFSYYCKCRRLVEIRQQIMRSSPPFLSLQTVPLSDSNLVPSTVPSRPLSLCERGETAAHFLCLLCCCFSCCRRRCQRHDVLMSATCPLPFDLRLPHPLFICRSELSLSPNLAFSLWHIGKLFRYLFLSALWASATQYAVGFARC